MTNNSKTIVTGIHSLLAAEIIKLYIQLQITNRDMLLCNWILIRYVLYSYKSNNILKYPFELIITCSAYATFKLFNYNISFQSIIISMMIIEYSMECRLNDYFNISFKNKIGTIVDFYNVYFVPLIVSFMNNLKSKRIEDLIK